MQKVVFFLLIIFIIGCQKTTPIISNNCTPPKLMVGSECCLDKDNNSICDDFQAKTAKPQNVKSAPKVETAFNLTTLERSIITNFSGTYNITFEDQNRENVTGIEGNFNVRSSVPSRFFILRMLKEYNYLNTYKNFSDFVGKRFELQAKNWMIGASSKIDYESLQDIDWKGVKYKYEKNLKEIDKSKIILEKHTLYFVKEKAVAYAYYTWFYIKANVWCTPELVVEIYSNESSEIWWSHSSLKDTQENIGRIEQKDKNSILPTAQRVAKICPN